jgi:nucleoside-diphosphate-sugar epimerase
MLPGLVPLHLYLNFNRESVRYANYRYMASPQRKKIFILGGTGFIGSALLALLQSKVHEFDVMVLLHRNYPFRQVENFNVYTGSLEQFDLGILDQFQPDVIVHLARLSGRGEWGRRKAAQRGARANQRLIDHLTRTACKPVILYISGTLVYGDCGNELVFEDFPMKPVAFAREYLLAETPWMEALQQQTLPVMILRPPWIVGKDSWFKNYYREILFRQGYVPVYGPGNNWMSVIDVVDCAGLVLHAYHHGQAGCIYNLFLPNGTLTQNEFAEKIAGMMNLPVVRFTERQVKKQGGRALWEAFSFSVKSATRYPDFLESYSFRFSSVEAIIRNNLSRPVSHFV